tara:strand:+ start:4279 stop:4614 length:336 start_codon:yes stop_codon:yes gene_type:complete
MLVGLALLPAVTTAHSAESPVKHIRNFDQTIEKRQDSFDQSLADSLKIQNLRDQLSAIESKIISIRNLMASDYPHIKDDMSKYKFDYMESVDNTLVQLRMTLAQTEKLLNP